MSLWRPSRSTDARRLCALMEGLEITNIDGAMRQSPELLRRVGEQIALAAKHGAPLYHAHRRRKAGHGPN